MKTEAPHSQASAEKHTTLQAVISRAEAAEADWQACEKLNAELLDALKRIQTLAAYMNSSGNGPEATLARIGRLAQSAIAKAEPQP